MTDSTPEYGFPLPSDQSRIASFPWHLRALSRTLEAKLPAALVAAARAQFPGEVARQTALAIAAAASAASTAAAALSTSRRTDERMTSLESAAGRGPSTPVDGQTAALIENSDTLTSGAVERTITSRAVVLSEAPLTPQRYGAVGDGVTDDTIALQRMVTDLQTVSLAGIIGGEAYIPAGEYVISDTLRLSKMAGIIRGAGIGNGAVSYGPGRTTTIRWAGPGDRPMVRAEDYRHLQIRDIRLQGNDATPPTCGIESHVRASMAQGHSSNLAVRNVHIGKFSWSSAGTNLGAVQAGIAFTGDNGNNDQWHVEDCFIRGAGVGIDVPNTQSIWSHLQDTTLWDCGVGVRTSAHMTGTNVRFQLCDIDWQVNSTAQVSVHGGFSEKSKRLVHLTHSAGRFIQYGGVWTLMDTLGNQPFIVHEDATNNGGLILHGVNIQNQVSPHPKIKARTKTSHLTPGRVVLTECRTNLTPGDLDVTTVPDSGNPGRIMVGLDFGIYAGSRVLLREHQAFSAHAPVDLSGTGTPEGAITAPVGSIYRRRDGAARDLTIWVKQTGNGATGWKPLSEA